MILPLINIFKRRFKQLFETIKTYVSIAFLIKLVKTHTFTGLTLLGLSMFLWAFYCGIAERIFHSSRMVNSEEIINTLAFQDAFAYNGRFGDIVILFFPFLFFGISILIHSPDAKRWVIGLSLMFGILLDIMVALVSSNNIHHFREINDENYSGSWDIRIWDSDYLGHVMIVVLCGVCGIIVLGGIYKIVRDQSINESNPSDTKSPIGLNTTLEGSPDTIEEG